MLLRYFIKIFRRKNTFYAIIVQNKQYFIFTNKKREKKHFLAIFFLFLSNSTISFARKRFYNSFKLQV